MADTATDPTTQTTTEDVLRDYEVTDSGPSRKRLRVRVSADVVDRRLGDSLDTLQEEAELPGFRRGRVPRALLEKRFGTDVRSRTRDQLVTEALGQAVERSGLSVVGDPFGTSMQDIALEQGRDLEFEVDIEVRPEFDLPEYEGLQLKRPQVEVDQSAVERELERICLNEGSLEPHDKAQAGDYLTGNARMVDGEGTEHYNIDGAVVQIPSDGGSGMILGVLVDDFGAQLGLPAIGDTLTITTRGPEQHEVEALRGKDLTITFEVTAIDKIVPLPVEELASRLGMETTDQVRQALQQRLEQRALIEQRSALRNQVARYLVQQTSFDLPERLTAQQAARALERRRMEMMYHGADPSMIELNIAELRRASAAEAQQSLKLFFVLSAVAEKLEVQVSEQEVRRQVAQMAIERGMRPEQLFHELIESKRINAVAEQVREHKTLDAIVDKAAITDVPADELAENEAATKA